MKKEDVEAILRLAKINVVGLTQLPNSYWPDMPDYQKLRSESPWWLVKTEHGDIRIGWRKRVISIEWHLTGLKVDIVNAPLTKDSTTMDEFLIHAWSEGSAVNYLAELWERLVARVRRQNYGREAVYKKRGVPTEFELAVIEAESRGFVLEKESRGYSLNNQKGVEAACANLGEVWSTLEFDPEFAAQAPTPVKA